MGPSDRRDFVHLGRLHQFLKTDCPYPAFRQSDIVCQCLQPVVSLGPLPDQSLPKPKYLKHRLALGWPSPDRRKLITKQQLKYQLCIAAVILVTRGSSFSYQNRIADKKLMTCFKEHVLEPCGPGRSLDTDDRRFGKRRIKLSNDLRIVNEIGRPCFPCSCVAPGKGLLMRMHINSDVQCHGGFSCQRTSVFVDIDSNQRREKPSFLTSRNTRNTRNRSDLWSVSDVGPTRADQNQRTQDPTDQSEH